MGRSRTRSKPTPKPEAPAPEPEVPTAEPEAPEEDLDAEIEEIAEEAPGMEAPGDDEPEALPEPEPEPAPVAEDCPACGNALRVVASVAPYKVEVKDQKGHEIEDIPVAYCIECGIEVARGAAEVDRHHGRLSILEVAMNHYGLAPEDLVPYLPTPGSGGCRIINAGSGVRLYTRKRGTLIYRLSHSKK